MSSLLMVIAGLWMADGLALLVVPLRMIALLEESLVAYPSLVNWSLLSSVLGAVLILQVEELPYHLFWLVIGLLMITKGFFWGLLRLRRPQRTFLGIQNARSLQYRLPSFLALLG